MRRRGSGRRRSDVTRRADNERLRDEAVNRFGRLDVFVANAGRGITRPVSQLTDDDVDDMMTTNPPFGQPRR